MTNVESYLDELITEIESSKGEIIQTTESYVGYYADVDGNGSVDGIIYVDLADTEKASGRWNNDNWADYKYTPVTEGLKEYTVSKKTYTGFGNQWEKPIITAVKESTGAERFYVMALDDVNEGAYYAWYDVATGKLDKTIGTGTNDFGDGEENTAYVMDKWVNEDWGLQNNNINNIDMWGVIQEEVEAGWFVPSKSEWSAFGCLAYNEMGVDESNYPNYGFHEGYWLSSQRNNNFAYYVFLDRGYINAQPPSGRGSVRLSTTF